MMCFADFTENPFHMVRTLKFNCNFMDKHFRLALNCIQKKFCIVATLMIHPRIMKIHNNLPGETPNDFPKFRGDWMYGF